MKKKRNSTLTGAAILFVTLSILVTLAVLIYAATERATGGNDAIIAGVMIAVIIVLAALCTVIDFFRRKYTVDEPVRRILHASDKIAGGDFSVRLDIPHPFNRYNEFDYISENFNKMAAELSRTEVLHSDFISNVSHEIKTPLAVIQSYASLLQKNTLDDKLRAEYAATIATASEKLAALVSNILKLNKLENQSITPEYENVDLTETLAQTVVGFEDIMEGKGLELDCDFAEDVHVYSSPAYLEIVFNNLLSNAVKFTERGGKISVSLKAAGDNAVICFSDTGCGISAETGKRIFEKFYQGDTSHSKEGNGLGLALVKRVIDIIGGKIEVNSEVGKGTAFTITLRAGKANG